MATIYICKCGRRVSKSTNADNTGNRDTKNCKGCPYLLPWGPTEWTGVSFVRNVKGYECRMSPEISYATDYSGSADDKCTMAIHSLDLDFLEDVQAWINEYADGQLYGRFSRDTIRGTDYCNKGRYSWSISCAQNKKGMAAKGALIKRFFGPDKHRLDKTPEEEKAIVLAAIEAGKAKAQKKEDKTLMYKDPVTGWLYRVGPEPFQGSYWVYYLDPTSSAIWKRCPQSSLYAGNETAEGEEEYLRLNAKRNGWEPMEEKEWNKPKTAPSADAAATSDGSAARMCEGPDGETQTTPAAASGAALESLHAQSVLPQNAPAQDIAVDAPSAQAFDYSGLDKKTAATLHAAERLIFEARRDYVTGLANAVHIAHEALCGGVVQNLDNSKHGNRGDDAFASWCASVGLKRSTAYNLLQVNALLSGATAEEQATLEAASPSLLYAAAKPSAPAELVQAVKGGDITTHKQYQEALAEIRARDAKIQELLEMSEGADRRADAAEARAKKAEQERDTARDAQAASSRLTNMITNQRDEAQIRAEKAELRARAAEEDAAEKDKRIRELETIRPQTIEATVVERTRMPEMAEEDAAELTTNLAASVTTVQRSFFMAAAAMAPQVKARCANTLWDTVNELATLLAASANPSYEEEEATPFD